MQRESKRNRTKDQRVTVPLLTLKQFIGFRMKKTGSSQPRPQPQGAARGASLSRGLGQGGGPGGNQGFTSDCVLLAITNTVNAMLRRQFNVCLSNKDHFWGSLKQYKRDNDEGAFVADILQKYNEDENRSMVYIGNDGVQIKIRFK